MKLVVGFAEDIDSGLSKIVRDGGEGERDGTLPRSRGLLVPALT